MPHSYLNLNLNLNLNPEPPTCFIGASSHTATQSRGASGLVALLGLLAASLLTVAVLDESVGGTGADNLFSWHPVNIRTHIRTHIGADNLFSWHPVNPEP